MGVSIGNKLIPPWFIYHLGFRCYKKKHGIKKWIPVKQKDIAPLFKPLDKNKFKKQDKSSKVGKVAKDKNSRKAGKQRRVSDIKKGVKLVKSLNITL